MVRVSGVDDESAPMALIVEDNDLSRRRLESLLNQRGYRIIEVLDGDAAVDEYVKHKPELVFLALDLPRLDGHIAALEMREHGKNVRIVFVAPRRLRSTAEDAAFSAGAVAWLERPVTESSLQQKWSEIQSQIPEAPGLADLDTLYPEDLESMESEVISLMKDKRLSSTTPEALESETLTSLTIVSPPRSEINSDDPGAAGSSPTEMENVKKRAWISLFASLLMIIGLTLTWTTEIPEAPHRTGGSGFAYLIPSGSLVTEGGPPTTVFSLASIVYTLGPLISFITSLLVVMLAISRINPKVLGVLYIFYVVLMIIFSFLSGQDGPYTMSSLFGPGVWVVSLSGFGLILDRT